MKKTGLKKCSEISLREVNRQRKAGTRPTGKFFLYRKSGKTGKVLLIHKDGRVSTAGGGVDEGETLVQAIVRENSEELKNSTLSIRTVRHAHILATGILDTTKLEWNNKKVYLIAVNARRLTDIKPGDDQHYDFMVLTIAKAIEYFQNHKNTPEETRKFYIAGLRMLAKLKGWKI